MTTNTLLESAVTRLSAQFPRLAISTIEEAVEECQTHLSEMPPGPLPELVERLAFWRLSERFGEQSLKSLLAESVPNLTVKVADKA